MQFTLSKQNNTLPATMLEVNYNIHSLLFSKHQTELIPQTRHFILRQTTQIHPRLKKSVFSFNALKEEEENTLGTDIEYQAKTREASSNFKRI